jgi:hypothetical protein
MEELFESVFQEAQKLEEKRSKKYYIGYYADASGNFQKGPKDVEEQMNQLSDVAKMETFLKKRFKGRDVKVEEDATIGW